MNNLKKYKTLKKNLLKQWDENHFEWFENEAKFLIKVNFENFITFEAGARPEYGLRFAENSEIEKVFGLPYTSSGDFAAVWNTNTQAKAKHGEPLYFNGVAIDEDRDGVLIFSDKNGEAFYFPKYDFITYQKEEREKEAAKDAAEFARQANEAAEIVCGVLKEFDGKPYGEKTKNKIYAEIVAQTRHFNFSNIYLNQNGLYILKGTWERNLENTFYFKYLNYENKIEVDSIELNKMEEFDGLECLNKANALSEKIQKEAAKLLEYVEEFNKMNNLLQKENKNTQIYNFQLRTAAKYGVKE